MDPAVDRSRVSFAVLLALVHPRTGPTLRSRGWSGGVPQLRVLDGER